MEREGLSLDALRSFSVFAGHLNFTRAAEQMHVSQPALHVKVQKVARAIGQPLYVRTGRRIELTPAGAAVADLAGRLDAELDAFERDLAGPSAEPAVLAAGAGAYRWVIPGAIRLLIAQRQRLRLLTLDSRRCVEAVRNGVAAVAITVLDSRPAGLDTRIVGGWDQMAVMPAGHALARRRKLHRSDLAGVDAVMSPPGRPQRRALEQADVAIRAVAEADSWDQMLHFVGLGVGLCIVNGCVQPPTGLVARPIVDLPRVIYSAITRPTDRHDPAVTTILDALRTAVP